MMHLDELDDPAILSEVHMETCPPRSESWCTRFYYSRSPPLPPSTTSKVVTLDDDGDMVIQRRTSKKDQHLVIHHSLATPVSRCGEQVWLGSCLLSDFLMSQQHMLQGGVVVSELGAGVGLASLTAAHFARQVFLTDADRGALLLAVKNRDANCASQRHHLQPEATASQPPHKAGSRNRAACPGSEMAAADALALPDQQTVQIRRLDWFALFDVQLWRLSDAEILTVLNSHRDAAAAASHQARQANKHNVGAVQQQERQEPQQQWDWTAADLEVLAATDVWMAADVIYDEHITDAFMGATHQLMLWQQQWRQRQQQQQQQQQQQEENMMQQHRQVLGAGTAVQPVVEGGITTSARLFVSLEKRFNFTLRDMDAKASAFEHFMTYVAPAGGLPLTPGQQAQPATEQQQQRQQQGNSRVGVASTVPRQACEKQPPLFTGRQLDVLALPQYLEYDRSADLELWELQPLPPA